MPTHDLPPELWDQELVLQAPLLSPTDQWLQQWPPSVSAYIVPLTASLVHTPLCASARFSMLQGHPSKCLVRFILQGISEEFRVGFTNAPSSLKAACHNLEGAQEHPEVVSEYISAEIPLSHIAGPFPPQAVPQVHVS